MEKSATTIPCKYVLTSSITPMFYWNLHCFDSITFTDLSTGLHFLSFMSSRRNFASLCQSPMRINAFHDNHDKLAP